MTNVLYPPSQLGNMVIVVAGRLSQDILSMALVSSSVQMYKHSLITTVYVCRPAMIVEFTWWYIHIPHIIPTSTQTQLHSEELQHKVYLKPRVNKRAAAEGLDMSHKTDSNPKLASEVVCQFSSPTNLRVLHTTLKSRPDLVNTACWAWPWFHMQMLIRCVLLQDANNHA